MKNYSTKLMLIMLFAGFISCQNSKEEQKQVEAGKALGEVDLQVTGNTQAVSHFMTGLLHLHSFEYVDAREAFLEAQKTDPSMVMAYWGEAMTHNHPLWSQQNYESATKALNKLGESKDVRLGKAQTDLEKDLLQGVEILFGSGEKTERDDLYARHMASLYEKYPDNNEVAAFYALSLLGSVETGRDYEIYGKGAVIAQGILSENPQHPGALHYLIHSYDDPDHASLALEAANNYSKVAPDAGHALHMPSHIYVAMGMWDEVISSNIASYEARLKKIERKGLNPISARNFHAYHWLLYGYLQTNQFDNAKEIMNNMKEFSVDAKSTGLRYYAIEMKGAYLAATNDYTGDYSGIQVNTEDLNVQSQASQLFLDGMQAVSTEDTEAIANVIAAIDAKIAAAATKLATKGITVCSATGFAARTPDQNDINSATVMLMELKAELAVINGNQAEAEEWLKAAVALEEDISYDFGPPSIFYPSYEVYGDWLVTQGRAKEALPLFDKALEKGPNRIQALEGKLAAAKALNDAALAQELQNQINNRNPQHASS